MLLHAAVFVVELVHAQVSPPATDASGVMQRSDKIFFGAQEHSLSVQAASMVKKRKADDNDLAPDELVRRQRQRVLQKLAIESRAQGRGYNPHKCKAHVYRDDNTAVVPRASQLRKVQQAEGRMPEGAAFQVRMLRYRTHQVQTQALRPATAAHSVLFFASATQASTYSRAGTQPRAILLQAYAAPP